MNNPFEELGDTRRNAKFGKRTGTIGKEKAPKVLTALEKKLYEQSEQLKMFRKWKREIRTGMTTGTYGPEVLMLLRLIRKLPDAKQLVHWVKTSKWLDEADDDIRYNVLSYISAALMRWNIRNGYPVFDDSLPGEPDSPFIIIRNHLESRDAKPSRNTRRPLPG